MNLTMGDFASARWNTKCVIQSVFLLTMVTIANHHKAPLPAVVGFNWETLWKFAVLAIVFYVMNAFLDLIFGCDHGVLYKKMAMWMQLPQHEDKPHMAKVVPVEQ